MFKPNVTSLFAISLIALLATACGDASLEVEGDDVELTEIEANLTSSQRRERSQIILRSAAEEGLTNGFLLAGIANAETGMAHCWSEATWACKGPASSSCGGGPVIAGSGDGPCSRKQGGLGYFQFDGGTHNQTLARDGHGILTVEGNTKKAVEFTVDMVIRSRYISGVSNRAQALAWMNEVRPNGNNWNTWIKTVTHYYNGCVPGRCRVYSARITSYSTKAVRIYNEFGHDFWYAHGHTPVPVEDLEAPANPGPVDASITGSQITLNWDSVEGARNYNVALEYTQDSGNSWKQYHTWTGRSSNSFTVWPQIDNTNYRWRVQACTSAGCSDFSTYTHFAFGDVELITAQPVAPIEEPVEPIEEPMEPIEEPEAPIEEPVAPEQPVEPAPIEEPIEEGLRAPQSMSPAGGTIPHSSVDLTWEEIDGASTYDVHMMYQKRNGTWANYYTWTRRSEARFQVWPQLDNTNYRWRVRACDGSECSDYSEAEAFYFTGR